MKAEDKRLLVKAICGYLPYGLEVNYNNEICDCVGYVHGKVILTKKFSSVSFGVDVEKVKPYLRPLLSMTEDEIKEWDNICVMMRNMPVESIPMVVKFVNSKHLDYYNLISKGLALEAPKDMY
jgi:hypothetical protein